MFPTRFTISLLLLIVSISWLGSTSNECTCENSVLVVPSSGPTVCLPLDDYIQLQNRAGDGDTAVAPTVSSNPSQSLAPLLFYRYMSPLWLQTHASFTETPSSVSAQSIEFGSGTTERSFLFKVNLIEAGVLDDEKAYSIRIDFFYTNTGNSDPFLLLCDGDYCTGYLYFQKAKVRAVNGINSLSRCEYGDLGEIIAAPQDSNNWHIRLEIHPNSTSGITFVGTTSQAHEFQQKLKPSQGLRFEVCRQNEPETFQFHLFELAVYSNE